MALQNPSRVPLAVSVAGWGAILLGSYLAFFGVFMFGMFTVGFAALVELLAPGTDTLVVLPGYEYLVVSSGVVGLLGLTGLLGGVGLLRRRAWGRHLCEIFCWIAIALVSGLTFAAMKLAPPRAAAAFFAVTVTMALLVQAPCVVGIWLLRHREMPSR